MTVQATAVTPVLNTTAEASSTVRWPTADRWYACSLCHSRAAAKNLYTAFGAATKATSSCSRSDKGTLFVGFGRTSCEIQPMRRCEYFVAEAPRTKRSRRAHTEPLAKTHRGPDPGALLNESTANRWIPDDAMSVSGTQRNFATPLAYHIKPCASFGDKMRRSRATPMNATHAASARIGLARTSRAFPSSQRIRSCKSSPRLGKATLHRAAVTNVRQPVRESSVDSSHSGVAGAAQAVAQRAAMTEMARMSVV
mmetsp:Transcript_24349/g.75439  ORF Transcript_24349/g.75439 Transcript_24349/m.75439 type:complete len:253 (+) Transcript_24349:206-964(+)